MLIDPGFGLKRDGFRRVRQLTRMHLTPRAVAPCALAAFALLAACDNSSEADTSGTGGSASASTTSAAGTSTSTGATTSTSSAMSSSAGTGGGPPVVVNPCDGLPAVGTFEDITPPVVKANGDRTFAIAADPVNQGVLYVGTVQAGVWKTVDCGANWAHITTGANGALVDSGMNWTMAVDPVEPNTVYTNSGYGSNGLFKSTNGGVDWAPIWPPAGQPELAAAFTYNFANVVAIDPSDHEHILLTFHEECLPPHPKTCIAETKDAGATWKLIDGNPVWNGNEGQVIFFLDDSTTWLWGSQTNGFWRMTGSGATSEAIPGMTTSHLQGSQLVRTKTGGYFVAGADGVWKSPNGTASSWSLIPDTGPIVGGLVLDDTTLYTSTCYFGNFCMDPRFLKSTDDGQTWTDLGGPAVDMGGTFAFDPGHGVLYSSGDVLLRIRVK
ncbi:MAG: hypothetical protein U0414_24030 [Polyangiaceae bacterium]